MRKDLEGHWSGHALCMISPNADFATRLMNMYGGGLRNLTVEGFRIVFRDLKGYAEAPLLEVFNDSECE